MSNAKNPFGDGHASKRSYRSWRIISGLNPIGQVRGDVIHIQEIEDVTVVMYTFEPDRKQLPFADL